MRRHVVRRRVEEVKRLLVGAQRDSVGEAVTSRGEIGISRGEIGVSRAGIVADRFAAPAGARARVTIEEARACDHNNRDLLLGIVDAMLC